MHGSGSAGPPATEVDHKVKLPRPPPALRQEHHQTGAMCSHNKLDFSVKLLLKVILSPIVVPSGSAGLGLFAHKMQDHPHGHQAREHSSEGG